MTDPVNAKLTIFNGAKVGGKDTILVYVFPDLGPTFVSVGKVIKKRRCRVQRSTSTSRRSRRCRARLTRRSLVETKTPKKTIKKGKRKLS